MIDHEQLLKFKLETSSLVELWKGFCQSHTELYELTCDEYLYLLESDIDQLEGAIDQKDIILERISALDTNRKEVIQRMTALTGKDLNRFDDLKQTLLDHNCSNEVKHLEGYNALLLDVIDKIQEQNKKNQVFLNKAIISLKDLKQSFSGKKNFKTYGADGVAKSNSSV